MADDLAGVGARIQALRQQKNLGQLPVAKACGISVSALSQLENGASKLPAADTLFRLADALDVSPRYLLFGHNDRVAPSLLGIRLSDSGKYRIRKARDRPDFE
jgi:transcriptional regulator with XRE-family HTH domain